MRRLRGCVSEAAGRSSETNPAGYPRHGRVRLHNADHFPYRVLPVFDGRVSVLLKVR